MISAPDFWSHDTWLARALAPLSRGGAAITARRVARPGWRAPVPVVCCGNATVGGAGKTTLALDLAHRLRTLGLAVHVLLRGHGGSAKGPRRVRHDDPASVTGDEAQLLAAVAPTWTGADRAASARTAIAAGADVLLMDDGLQNPSLVKTLSLLTIDGATGFGNGRVLPAGPLREPAAIAAARCQAAILIGRDLTGALARLPPELPVLRAHLQSGPEIARLSGHRVLAFAGLAIPAKFFAALDRAGVDLAGTVAFPDHHPFTPRDLARLVDRAAASGAILATTPKDAVRLPPAMRAQVVVVGVGLVWEEEVAIDALLRAIVLSPPAYSPRRDRIMP